MKKLFFIIGLSLLSAARAATLTDILSPSNQALQKACDEGYRISSLPRSTREQKDIYLEEVSKTLPGLSLSDRRTFLDMEKDYTAYFRALIGFVRIQTASGSAYNVCSVIAAELEDKVPANSLPTSTYIYIGGRVDRLKDAENWNAVISILDAAGNEIKRYQPISSNKGRVDGWKTSCTISECSWVGSNDYKFQLGVVDPQSAKIRVIFNRDSGVEQREYTAEDFTKTFLSDPK